MSLIIFSTCIFWPKREFLKRPTHLLVKMFSATLEDFHIIQNLADIKLIGLANRPEQKMTKNITASIHTTG